MFSSTIAVFGALSTGGTVAAVTAFAAVAEIGLAVTAIGAITGSEDMMKVGGAMSLVGGVGSLAAGAISSMGGAAAAEGAAAGAAAGAENGIINSAGEWAAGGSLADAALNAAATDGLGIAAAGSEAALNQGIINGAAGIAQDSLASTALQGAASEGLTGQAAQAAQNGMADYMSSGSAAHISENVAGLAADPAAATASANAAAGPVTPMDQTYGPEFANETMGTVKNVGDTKGSVVSQTGKADSNSILGKMNELGQWAEKNKTLAGLITNVGSNMVKGAITAGYQSKAQKEQMELKKRELAIAERNQRNREAAPGVSQPYSRPIINGAR